MKKIVWFVVAIVIATMTFACSGEVEGSDCPKQGATKTESGHTYRCDWAGDNHSVWTKVN